MSFALHPRLAADTLFVSGHSGGQILLMNDSRFPWLLIVPEIDDAKELHALPAQAQHALLNAINLCSGVLSDLFQPYKLNVAAIGNVVAQLHVHVVARYTNDAAWPNPVWGQGQALPYETDQAEALLARLRPLLEA